MKYYFAALILFWLATGCQENDPNQIVLTIEVENAPKEEKLQIVRLNKDRARFTHAEFDGGQKKYLVKFEKRQEPEFAELHLFKNRIEILVLTGQSFKIKVDMNKPEYFEVEGSPDTKVFKDFIRLDEQLQKEVEDINTAFTKGEITNEQAVLSYESLRDKTTSQYKEFFQKNMASPVAVMAFENQLFKKDTEWKFLQEVASEVAKRFPGTDLSAELSRMATTAAQTGIGNQAPEIGLANTKGEPITLSSLRGKYVLVDFWASWCKPCRLENPNLVKLYEKYKNKNFEILGTSLDNDRQKWLDAIAADKLVWVQGIDDAENTAGRTYNVQGIPHSVLIDPNGVIVAKDLRGEALAKKLEEIFNN